MPPPNASQPLYVSPLPTSTAHLLSLSFALCYVGSLYISNQARLKFERAPSPSSPDSDGDGRQGSGNRDGRNRRNKKEEPKERAKLANERWRDDPDVIKARLGMASLASLVCCVAVGVTVYTGSGADYNRLPEVTTLTLAYLGVSLPLSSSILTFLHPWTWNWDWLSLLHSFSRLMENLPYLLEKAWYTLRPHLVVPLLFLGPLYVTSLEGTLPFQRRWTWKYFKWMCGSWIGIRSHIVGPITEEIVFRACVLAVYHMGHLSKTQMVFLTPLSFGVAHLHHAWDVYNRYGRTRAALNKALGSTVLQLAYTTLFGFLAAYLFLNSGSLLPPITAHMFCNVMGLPMVWDEVRRWRLYRRSIITAYILGIVGFWYTLSEWTKYPLVHGRWGVWDEYRHRV